MIDSILKDFPGFFEKIVKTTSDAGPLALGILLLCFVAAGVYLFRNSLANSRPLKIVAVVLVAVVGGVLVVFIVQSFQFWLAKQNSQPVVVIQGSIRYQLPDLYFDPKGISRKAGDPGERFYSYDKSFTEKRVLAIAKPDTKPDTIELIVSNRQIYRNCPEDLQVNTRSKFNSTTFEISFGKDAYLPSSGVNDGIVLYEINFDYLTRHGSTVGDFLRVSGFQGIDPSKVTIKAQHEPDRCLDEDPRAQFAEIVKPATWNGPLDVPVHQALSLIAAALISPSFGQATTDKVDKAEVVKLLGSTDVSLATKAKSEVSQDPASYAPAIADLLRRNTPDDAARQANALLALKGAAPRPFQLPPALLTDVIRLSYSGPPDVRQTARSYLTDPAIVDESLVKTAAEFYAREGAKVKATGPDRLLPLLITLREIYYVAGINKVVDYVGNWGERPRDPNAIDEGIQDFSAAIALINDAPPTNVVPFAKAYYGMALAIRSRVAVNAAMKSLGDKATSKQIDQQISTQVASRAPLPFTDEEKANFISTIDSFLAIVKGRESEYQWPDHIKKMKACKARPSYDCLHTG